jgi:FMN phosphatase YigB (HAD superfamily)|tara:strand:- start:398 stop:778 length:381 start_codon:yes stop_codon:yes gene_type:complete
MNIFFDVDNTLIMWDGKLRNNAEDVFKKIIADGHTIYIWSGIGIRKKEIENVNLDKYVKDYFIKPLYDHRARLPKLGVNVDIDYVIDDHESVVQVFGGYHIPDVATEDDQELIKVLEDIRRINKDS